MVRREDVRATEKDRVVILEGFRVGDLVRGVVVSLGFFLGGFCFLGGGRGGGGGCGCFKEEEEEEEEI